MILASFPSLGNPFYSEIINGLEIASHQRGYRLFMQQLTDPWLAANYNFLLDTQIYDGIIFFTVSQTRKSEIPCWPVTLPLWRPNMIQTSTFPV
jgi:DNA-binding LacI/PurR family transcriptional regulator